MHIILYTRVSELSPTGRVSVLRSGSHRLRRRERPEVLRLPWVLLVDQRTIIRLRLE